jgi:hypothetical protein
MQTTLDTTTTRARPAWQRKAAQLRRQIRESVDDGEQHELRLQLLWALYTPWKRGER